MRKRIHYTKHYYFLIIIVFHLFSCGIIDSMKLDTAEKTYNNSIKIGILNSHQEGHKAKAETQNLAASLAEEEINSQGGLTINGVDHDIQLVFRDDIGDYSTGRVQLENLYNQGIRIIIGPAYSGVALGDLENGIPGVAQLAVEKGMLMISYSATNPFISGKDTSVFDDPDDFIWRTCPLDSLLATIGSEWAYNNSGVTRAGIVYRSDAWGVDLAAEFTSAFLAIDSGNEVLNSVSIDVSSDVDLATHDYTDELDLLFSGQPDIIFLILFRTEGVAISNAIANGGYLSPYGSNPPQFFSAPGLKISSFLVNGNPAVTEGMYGIVASPDEESLNYQAFRSNFKERYDFDHGGSGMMVEYIYDNVYLIAYAMLYADSTDPNSVKNYLRTAANDNSAPDAIINVNSFAEGRELISSGYNINYEGASGSIDFDVYGDPGSGRYEIWKIENGEYITAEVVSFP